MTFGIVALDIMTLGIKHKYSQHKENNSMKLSNMTLENKALSIPTVRIRSYIRKTLRIITLGLKLSTIILSIMHTSVRH
jgi:hypothetical protein